jgi:hypothetical protein
MSLQLNLIEFDQNGNLYVNYKDHIYMLCINSVDDLFLEKIINKNNNLIKNYDNVSSIESKLKKAQKENK